jgi:hypothetical protein
MHVVRQRKAPPKKKPLQKGPPGLFAKLKKDGISHALLGL